jgi:hypothetical protein
VEARFSSFGNSANLDARYVHALRRTYHKLLGDVGHVESRFGPFGVLVSVQDRCMVCVKRTISSKIIFNAPDGTPR